AGAEVGKAWVVKDSDGRRVLKEMLSGQIPQMPEWLDLRDSIPGTLDLAYTGGGSFNFLVMSGEQRGKVWAAGEFIAPDFDFGDETPHSFFSWYECWLDDCLRPRPLPNTNRTPEGG